MEVRLNLLCPLLSLLLLHDVGCNEDDGSEEASEEPGDAAAPLAPRDAGGSSSFDTGTQGKPSAEAPARLGQPFLCSARVLNSVCIQYYGRVDAETRAMMESTCNFDAPCPRERPIDCVIKADPGEPLPKECNSPGRAVGECTARPLKGGAPWAFTSTTFYDKYSLRLGMEVFPVVIEPEELAEAEAQCTNEACASVDSECTWFKL